MEHKTIQFEIKTVDYTGRTLEGFAAAFGNIDQVGDIIHPGAFRKTLAERGPRIKFLWQHDPTEPIGKLLEAHEQDGGLFVKAIVSDTQRGRDALALLKDGAIGEMSIGYDTVKGGMDYSKNAKGETVRNLREIKLYEFSLVTFPANEQAVVTSVKSEEKRVKSIGTIAESQIHSYFTSMADSWYGMEAITRDERIALSSAIGDALQAFINTVTEKAPQLYSRPVIDDYENASKGGDPVSQQKVGRTISAANLAKLKAARDVIDELMAKGYIRDDETEDEEDEETKSLDLQNKSATIQASQVDEPSDTLTTAYDAAGPVQPPTDRLLKLIELELSDLHYSEVTQ